MCLVSEWCAEWVSDVMSEWVICCVVLSEWVMCWVSEGCAEWASDLLSEWGMCWVSEWCDEWVSDVLCCVVLCWVSEWVMCWVSEWYAEWVIDVLSEWVMCWMSENLSCGFPYLSIVADIEIQITKRSITNWTLNIWTNQFTTHIFKCFLHRE